MYAYAIGQCGIKPKDYWQLTEAETIGIIAGHQRLESYDAEKFRNIYAAMIRYMGEKGNIQSIWPLPTDYDNQVTKEYIEERNKRAVELGKKLGIINAEC